MGLRRMISARPLVVIALLAAQGCSSGEALTATPIGDLDVTGSWTLNHDGPVVPGSSFVMTMSDSSGTVSGGGSFAGEAGPFGTLRVRGIHAQDSLRIQIVYDFDSKVFPSLHPDTADFAGKLTSRDHIDGTVTRDGSTSPIGFVRVRD